MDNLPNFDFKPLNIPETPDFDFTPDSIPDSEDEYVFGLGGAPSAGPTPTTPTPGTPTPATPTTPTTPTPTATLFDIPATTSPVPDASKVYSIYSFGSNTNGQLGSNTTTNTSTIVQEVTADTKWTALSMVAPTPTPSNYIALNAFNDATYGVKLDGSLWSWGNNTLGKLGNNTTTNRSSPTQVGTDLTWVQVSSGYNHAAAIKSDYTLWTWGRNTEGALGDNTITHRSSPVQILGGGTWVQVACGYNMNFGIKKDASLWSWGSNSYGGLGDNTTTHRSSPVQILTSCTKTWAGYNTGCAIGTTAQYYWGRNDYGQLGLGNTTHRSSPTQMAAQNSWNYLSFGKTHTVASGSYNGSANTLYTWGRNNYGQLGNGTVTDSSNPAITTMAYLATNYEIAVGASSESSYVVRLNGTVWSWGRNSEGQLGDNTITHRSSPTMLTTSGIKWLQVSGGKYHTALLTATATNLFLSGSNGYGQLGDGLNGVVSSRSLDDLRQTISSGINWTKISATNVASFGIKSDGTLWSWGANYGGVLAHNNILKYSSPLQVYGQGTTWKEIAASNAYSAAAIKTDGTLWTWGVNNIGRLGDNTIIHRSSPVQITGGGTIWSSVSCGYYCSTAIKTDGTLWTWGHNLSGVLGDNTVIHRSSPVQITGGGTTWSSVSGGTIHTAGIKTDGTLWCWGSNSFGQLGDNTIINRSSPVQITGGGTTWSSVSGGYYHTAGIKKDGTLWTWGYNDSGQLGDNTIIHRSSPVQIVGGGTNWKQISATRYATIGVKTDGTIWKIGYVQGISKSSPVQLSTGNFTWGKISASNNHLMALTDTIVSSTTAPTMFWPNPNPILDSSLLTGNELMASVLATSGGTNPGAIVYQPSFDTVLPLGTYTLWATSLPTAYYNTQSISQTIQVSSGASLDLNFAAYKTLVPSVGPTPSFTRASTGTYFNASGVLTTAAINVPRFDHIYNGVSWVSKGLLIEEQRVNYVKYATDLSTNWANEAGATREYNSIVSPDGGTNATKVNVAVSGFSGIYQFPLSNGSTGTYTYSIFAKKGTKDWLVILNAAGSGSSPTSFNISNGTIGTVFSGYSATILDVGNGWYRCILTTASSTTPSWFQIAFVDANNSSTPASTGYSYVYGAQVELGSFPTSYIPTTTTQLTRSADVCQITGGDFSGFYNQTEGSFAVNYDCPANGTLVQYQANSAVSTNIHDAVSIGTTQYFEVYLPPTQALINAGSIVANLPQGLSSAYKINDFAASLNGGAVATDTAGSLPTPTKLIIGSDGSSYNNGHIARLRYYNVRVNNTQLKALSTPTPTPTPFDPLSISGLQFWVDAADSATLYTDSTLTTLAVADDDVIGGWKDKSGNSRNALQNDGAKKPLLKLAIQNGRNVVRWDNTNDILSTSVTLTLGLHTTFFVYRLTQTTGSRSIIFISNAGLTNYTASIVETSLAYISDSAGVSNVADTSTAWNQRTDSRTALTGARFSGRINGAARTISSATGTYTPTANPINLGNYNAATNSPLNGDIAEVLVYDSALSGSDILLVEAYLKAKWGTP